MDHLNSDLCLDNDVSDSKKTGTSKKATSRNRKRKNAALEEYGYHFIAYVPSGGHVWELDGLRTNPLNLGERNDDSIVIAVGNLTRILRTAGIGELDHYCQAPDRNKDAPVRGQPTLVQSGGSLPLPLVTSQSKYCQYGSLDGLYPVSHVTQQCV
jgi:hypothetical protein